MGVLQAHRNPKVWQSRLRHSRASSGLTVDHLFHVPSVSTLRNMGKPLARYLDVLAKKEKLKMQTPHRSSEDTSTSYTRVT